jgi:hypothetical protein
VAASAPPTVVFPKNLFVQANQSDFSCPVLIEEIFRFPRRANHLYKLAPSRPNKGAFRDRHEREAGCDGR